MVEISSLPLWWVFSVLRLLPPMPPIYVLTVRRSSLSIARRACAKLAAASTSAPWTAALRSLSLTARRPQQSAPD